MRFSAPSRLARALRADRSPGPTRRLNGGTLFMVLAVVSAAVSQCGPTTPTNPTPQRRVDLKVLVLNDGSVGATVIRDELKLQGVPYREVDLNAAGRPAINDAFLSVTTSSPNQERAYYQAVVSPNEAPSQLSAAEQTALKSFEAKFGIRRVNAYTWANPAVGLNYAAAPNGSTGALDGVTGAVTPAGKSSGFGYLNGPVPFEVGSYGYVATPLAPQATGNTFTPLVTAPVAGAPGVNGSVLGVFASGGREELVITSSFSLRQQQFRLLGRGIVAWMTKGVHLGHDRNYFTVHVDDLFAADDRWNSAQNCTFNEDCPPNVPQLPKIRMTPADVTAVVNWQKANGFTFEMAWNGLGSVDHAAETGKADPLLAAIKANKSAFTYLNHTYSHEFLGCVQDRSVIPWRCATNANGTTQWVTRDKIVSEINQNKTFGQQHGLPFNAAELLTGEHSGLFILPQQPTDNPNLAPAFTLTGIKNTGADASRDFNPRSVGPARTVPRYPLNVFFNAATKVESADEYNWIFTSKADGGSGICTANPATMTCLAPISTTTGFDDWIVPFDTTQAIRRITANDPRPHYAHQSNLAEDRTLLTLTGSILNRYKSLYATSAPIVTVRQTQASDLLSQQAAWGAGAGQVQAYQIGKEIFVERNGFTGRIPVTMPNGTRAGSTMGVPFGQAYAGERSDWVLPTTNTYKLVLP